MDAMTRVAIAFACGLLFALGLTVSGMTQPSKVIAFLDVTGDWDPSLAFVMIGAIGVFAPAYRWALRRARPVLCPDFAPPASGAIDARLIIGAALFGLGWGASGYCPGPAITSAAAGGDGVLVFLAAMLTATLVARALTRAS
jgi:uncharacterized membrane protein YedE/YeeE